MSATVIDGGPAGPDEASGQYRNRILTDRAAWWEAMGGAQGVLDGFDWSVVAGQMALEFTPGKAALEERDTLGVANTGRGYLVWQDADNLATFDAPSASSRNDAVVLAFVDVAVGTGALGTQTSVVGGQIVVVPGVSGTTTPRTDADVQAAVGSGAWVRLLDVQVDPADTEINPANITENTPAYFTKWQDLPLQPGFTGPGQVRLYRGVLYFRGQVSGTYATGSVITIVAGGGVPDGMRPGQRANVQLAGHAQAAAVRAYVETTGQIDVVTGPSAPNYVALEGLSAAYPPG